MTFSFNSVCLQLVSFNFVFCLLLHSWKLYKSEHPVEHTGLPICFPIREEIDFLILIILCFKICPVNEVCWKYIVSRNILIFCMNFRSWTCWWRLIRWSKDTSTWSPAYLVGSQKKHKTLISQLQKQLYFCSKASTTSRYSELLKSHQSRMSFCFVFLMGVIWLCASGFSRRLSP